MIEKSIEKELTELMEYCELGKITEPIRPVSGGFLHRMYRIATESGIYAVKHLNTEIMKRPGALLNFARAEELEEIIQKEKIAIVPSLTFHGKKMQQKNGNYYYLFRWQEGSITDWNNITKEQCRQAGHILGQIHAIQPKKTEHIEPELSKIDWDSYCEKAVKEKSEIASLLKENEALLISCEEEMNQARILLPDLSCISDEDMDPKNVMWTNGNPYVIDLECLDRGNPISHSLQLSLQWSGITTCSLDLEKTKAFLGGYRETFDCGECSYRKVFGLAYTWVEWLQYNIERALQIHCMDEAEKRMGISEVKNTIRRIRYLREKEEEIKAILDR